MQFVDLDVWHKNSSDYDESIVLKENYGNSIYVIPDDAFMPNSGNPFVPGRWLSFSQLDRGTACQPSRSVPNQDNGTLHSGLAVSASSDFKMEWWGYGCGTTINGIYGNSSIKASADVGGTITDQGNTIVPWKNDKNYIVTADKYYQIDSILVDDASIPISDPTRQEYEFREVVTNHTIHASFERKKHTVTYEPNIESSAGTTPSTSHDAGSTAEISSNGFIPPNEKEISFAGWNTSPDGSGTAYAPNDAIFVDDEDIILYAQWKAAGLSVSKKLSLIDNGGGGALHNVRKLTISARGKTYAQSGHLVLVMDRTGSLRQVNYDAISKSFQKIAFELMQTENVSVSCVLFAGLGADPTSAYWDGYHVPFVASKDVTDLDKMNVPVSPVHSGVINGVNYNEGTGGTSWSSGFKGLEDVLRAISSQDSGKVDIVFFSDGGSDCYLDESDGQCKNAMSYAIGNRKGMDKLKSVMDSYADRISSFSTIALKMNGPETDLSAMQELSDTSVAPYGKRYSFPVSAIFESSAQAVSDQLSKIVNKNLIDGHASDVSIVDYLSDNVVVAETDEKGRPALSVDLISASGMHVGLSEGADYAYSYNMENKKITISYSHELSADETISISLLVRPSASCIASEVSEIGEKDIGDVGTGEISEGKRGWKTNMGAGNDIVTSSTPWGMPTSAVLPTPVIQPEIGRVVYDKNAEDANGSMQGHAEEIGTSITVRENGFSREAYSFAGWSTKADAVEAEIWPGNEMIVSKEITTLYAQWTKNPVITINITGAGHADIVKLIGDKDAESGDKDDEVMGNVEDDGTSTWVVPIGDNIYVDWLPAEGRWANSVMVDGKEIDADSISSWDFCNVREDHVVNIVFLPSLGVSATGSAQMLTFGVAIVGILISASVIAIDSIIRIWRRKSGARQNL